MKFKFRYKRPTLTEWFECEAESFTDAIQTHHHDNQRSYDVSITVENGDGGREVQSFAVIEDEKGEEWISRVCNTGLFRKGGVKPYPVRDLAYVAEKLGVVIDRLQGPWEGEETYDDVRRREHG